MRSQAGRGVDTKVTVPLSCRAITLPAGLKVAPPVPKGHGLDRRGLCAVAA